MNKTDELRAEETRKSLRHLEATVYLNYKQFEMLKNQVDDLTNQLINNGTIKTRPSTGDASDEEALLMYEETMNELCDFRNYMRSMGVEWG